MKPFEVRDMDGTEHSKNASVRTSVHSTGISNPVQRQDGKVSDFSSKVTPDLDQDIRNEKFSLPINSLEYELETK